MWLILFLSYYTYPFHCIRVKNSTYVYTWGRSNCTYLTPLFRTVLFLWIIGETTNVRIFLTVIPYNDGFPLYGADITQVASSLNLLSATGRARERAQSMCIHWGQIEGSKHHCWTIWGTIYSSGTINNPQWCHRHASYYYTIVMTPPPIVRRSRNGRLIICYGQGGQGEK